MDVEQRVQQLFPQIFYFRETEFYISVSQQACQVMFAEIEHQEKRRSIIVIRTRWKKNEFSDNDHEN